MSVDKMYEVDIENTNNKRRKLINNKIFSLLIFILSLSHNGCNNKPGERSMDSFSGFPNTSTLESVKTNAKAYFSTANLQVFDSLLVLTTTDLSVNKIIHVYNKTTFNHILSTGMVGKGPGEIGIPGWNTWSISEGVIWFPDNSKGVIWKFEIDSILKNSEYKPKQTFHIPSDIFIPKTKAQYSEELFSYAVDNPEYYFYLANKRGEIIDSLNVPNKTSIYPNLDQKKISYTVWYYYLIHPSEEKIFIAYHYADIVVCTDFQGNILFIKQGPDNIQEKPKHLNPLEAVKNERKSTYWCLRADSNYVYCLYSGRNFFRMKEDKPIPQYGKQLFVFTWEGIPVIRFELDRPATKFALDKENNRIITFAKDIGNLVYYHFPFEKLNDIQ